MSRIKSLLPWVPVAAVAYGLYRAAVAGNRAMDRLTAPPQTVNGADDWETDGLGKFWQRPRRISRVRRAVDAGVRPLKVTGYVTAPKSYGIDGELGGIGKKLKKKLRKAGKSVEKIARPVVRAAQVVTRPLQRGVAAVREKVIKPVVGKKIYGEVSRFTKKTNRIRWLSALSPGMIPLLAMDKRTRKPALQVAAVAAATAAAAAGAVAAGGAIAAGGGITAAGAGAAVTGTGTALEVARQAGLFPDGDVESVDTEQVQEEADAPGFFDGLMADIDGAGRSIIDAVEV